MKNITFINAGAGSGKTHSLIGELYTHIARGNCRGDEVLVTTFTRKAAEEIRQRAYASLLEGGKSDDAILLQNAYMGTVHSIGYRLIRKFCYLVGLSPDIRELPEEDADFYFTQAISSIPTVEELDQLDHLTEKFRFQSMGDNNNPVFDPEKWKEHVIGIIREARRNRIEDLTAAGLSFRRSMEFAAEVFEWNGSRGPDDNTLRRNAEYLFTLIEGLPEKNNKGRKNDAKELAHTLAAGTISYSCFPSLHKLAADILSKVDPANRHAAEIVSGLDEFYRTLGFEKDITAYIRLIFGIAGRCLEAFDRYKLDHALVDYTDMEIRFLELLELDEVRRELGPKLKLVLVDEFQDSNPVQLAIFVRLAALAGRSIWVGDPKQSIYGFNGADPRLVNAILDLFYANRESTLNIKLLKNSWRSRPDLVSFANEIFGISLEDQSHPFRISRQDVLGDKKLLETWLEKTFGKKEEVLLPAAETIRLIPVRKEDEEGFGQDESSLALKSWHFTNSFPKAGNKEEFNWYLARKIRELINKGIPVFDKHTKEIRPLKPSDIAVLCRKNNDVKAISAELLKNGLEVSALVDGLTATAEYRFMVNILSYVADPSNSLSVAEILLLVQDDPAISPEALLEERLAFMVQAKDDAGDDNPLYYSAVSRWGKDHPFIIRLDAFARVSNHLSVPELIEKLVPEMEMERYISAWGNDRQRKANLRQMIRFTYEYDNYCLRMNLASGLAGFVNWISLRREKDTQAASASETAVNVLTYHKAKGLEWPIVILAGLDRQVDWKFMENDFFSTSVGTDGALDIGSPLAGRYIRFSFWPFGSKGNIMGWETRVRGTERYLESEQLKLREWKRLLYVGMTRARDYLVLTRFKNKEQAWFNLGTNDADIMTTGIPVHTDTIEDTRAEFSFDYDEQEYTPGLFFEKRGSERQDNPKYISPSSLEGKEGVSVKVVQDTGHRIRLAGIEDETLLGTCLHDILYLGPAVTEEKVRSILDRHGLTGRVDVQDILTAVADLDRFITSLGPDKIYRELPLRMGKEGHVWTGSADMVLEFPDHLVLIDFKSFPGQVSEILDLGSRHFAGMYEGQMEKYAEMLEAAIGKKVAKKMICYIMNGNLVEIDLHPVQPN